MKNKFLIPLSATTLAGLAAFYLYPHLPAGAISVDKLTFAFMIAMAITAATSIWYFVTSLKDFKTSTKVAYYTIAAGIFFFAFTQLEQLLLAFVTIDNDVLVSLMVLVPYVFSTTTMYIGVRKLARLLGLNGIWSSIWFTVGFAIATGIALAQVPTFLYADPGTKDSAIQLFGIIGATAGFSAVAAILAMRIKNTISSTYKGAMAWLGLALAALTLATVHEIVAKGSGLLFTNYVQGGYSMWPFVAACVFFMRAAFVFKQAGVKAATLPENATYLDAVVYAAQLVSNPREIDPILNELRQVTASIPKDNKLSDTDKSTLVEVYEKIEDYLITKEPLRKLDKAVLRARLTSEFQTELNKHEGALSPQAA
jgi:hypothetical protein